MTVRGQYRVLENFLPQMTRMNTDTPDKNLCSSVFICGKNKSPHVK
jgi:hypothetical protein